MKHSCMVDNFLVSHGALCRVVCSRCLIRFTLDPVFRAALKAHSEMLDGSNKFQLRKQMG